MKTMVFNLDSYFVSEIFKPLRTKSEILVALMKCTKYMMIGNTVPEDRKVGEMILVISKRSRIFLASGDKYYSLVFPFSVTEHEGALSFSSKLITSVDNKVTSDVIGILNESNLNGLRDSLEYVEGIVDLEMSEPLFWPFLVGLLTYEDGYVRYDHDPVNQDGDSHPLDHYDFFYSADASCKIGLRDRVDVGEMIKFVMPDSACQFIEPSSD